MSHQEACLSFILISYVQLTWTRTTSPLAILCITRSAPARLVLHPLSHTSQRRPAFIHTTADRQAVLTEQRRRLRQRLVAFVLWQRRARQRHLGPACRAFCRIRKHHVADGWLRHRHQHILRAQRLRTRCARGRRWGVWPSCWPRGAFCPRQRRIRERRRVRTCVWHGTRQYALCAVGGRARAGRGRKQRDAERLSQLPGDGYG